ncbi:MAG: hypothetical protein HY720_10745 [Planctomycetes bacterium]|nr:hypothetical protein [Planctomycetota bacterium]
MSRPACATVLTLAAFAFVPVDLRGQGSEPDDRLEAAHMPGVVFASEAQALLDSSRGAFEERRGQIANRTAKDREALAGFAGRFERIDANLAGLGFDAPRVLGARQQAVSRLGDLAAQVESFGSLDLDPFLAIERQWMPALGRAYGGLDVRSVQKEMAALFEFPDGGHFKPGALLAFSYDGLVPERTSAPPFPAGFEEESLAPPYPRVRMSPGAAERVRWANAAGRLAVLAKGEGDRAPLETSELQVGTFFRLPPGVKRTTLAASLSLSWSTLAAATGEPSGSKVVLWLLVASASPAGEFQRIAVVDRFLLSSSKAAAWGTAADRGRSQIHLSGEFAGFRPGDTHLVLVEVLAIADAPGALAIAGAWGKLDGIRMLRYYRTGTAQE